MVSLQAEPAIDHASFADRRKYRDDEPAQPGHTAISADLLNPTVNESPIVTSPKILIIRPPMGDR